MDGHKTRNTGAEAAEKVLEAAAGLLGAGGVDAVSTRAVAAAAGVQPPTIYRQFGDKQGLLDAVTEYVLQRYLQDKRRAPITDDPVQDLRDSWDLHVDFGLTHPDCYILAYVQAGPGRMPALARESLDICHRLVARIGDHGLLKMSVKRAVEFVHAAGVGYVLAQIRVPPEERDPELAAITRENAIAAIATDSSRRPAHSGLSGRAVALREALLDNVNGGLTPGEKTMMAEWLDRLADQAHA
ncbi:TetR/AcrR family transcriptional regulator [Mycobacterium montefiorense]|uniref:TetR family transcriptional regulator n=1 Tax=Mycobacterium montefiorense TaxID=154654 RepID=A0ABQ0NMT1_9MYCO|nr:TetR/AcrR family transcriptional regulator [Mycobacterium montefiorense]GBG38149.1 TetR family transcriptional regulator [Mycobacterium montefiorense]GKU33700.1 TetR family transcriptional regulator [Mycobacterium montefiorense]GKU39472.1 TetR family transcriptional regulator [Mycobacterium montefiorense]GKU44539.1 TetR family transcriptional regulator [Mycobacterium montefiorense]GKU51646.1 TetR family transcriptional regulator [Mycobacterium montefiorense]